MDTQVRLGKDSIGKNKENIKRKTFVKPTVEEIAAYCKERCNSINADAFYNFYEANGWIQGKGKPIRDWKACIRTWELREGKKEEKPEWYGKEFKKEELSGEDLVELEDLFKDFKEN